jgi:hypothetical protein
MDGESKAIERHTSYVRHPAALRTIVWSGNLRHRAARGATTGIGSCTRVADLAEWAGRLPP